MKLPTLLKMLPVGNSKGFCWAMGTISRVENDMVTASILPRSTLQLRPEDFRETRFDANVRPDGVSLLAPRELKRPPLHVSVLALIPDPGDAELSEDDVIRASVWISVVSSLDYMDAIPERGLVRVVRNQKVLWIGFGDKLPPQHQGFEEVYDLDTGWPKQFAGGVSLAGAFKVLRDPVPTEPDLGSLKVVAIGDGRQSARGMATIRRVSKGERPRPADVGQD